MIDSYRTDMEISLAFAAEAAQIAPTYYVTGNHEARIAEYGTFQEGLKDAGVIILSDERILIRAGAGLVLRLRLKNAISQKMNKGLRKSYRDLRGPLFYYRQKELI